MSQDEVHVGVWVVCFFVFCFVKSDTHLAVSAPLNHKEEQNVCTNACTRCLLPTIFSKTSSLEVGASLIRNSMCKKGEAHPLRCIGLADKSPLWSSNFPCLSAYLVCPFCSGRERERVPGALQSLLAEESMHSYLSISPTEQNGTYFLVNTHKNIILVDCAIVGVQNPDLCSLIDSPIITHAVTGRLASWPVIQHEVGIGSCTTCL